MNSFLAYCIQLQPCVPLYQFEKTNKHMDKMCILFDFFYIRRADIG